MIINRKTEMSILLPEEPTARECFAAEELQKYLELILGVRFPIEACGASASKKRILIGGPERNKLTRVYISEEQFDREVPGPEGMMLRTLAPDTLLLAGSSKNPNERERGTLYAVYELLERYCGCSLSAFSSYEIDAGEYVPRLEEISLSSVDYVKASADLPYRCAIVQYSNSAGNPDRALNGAFYDWLAKNRYNRVLIWASIYNFFKKSGFLSELERRGFSLTVGHHEASKLFIPPNGSEDFPTRYREAHPEYFKLTESGERAKNDSHFGQWIFCSRCDGLIDEFAENVSSWVSRNPLVDVVAIWPNDGIDEQCTCDSCRRHSKIENYAYFNDAVVKKVNKVHPHVKFDMLVYVDLWECPEGFKLSDSVIIDESTWHISGLRRGGKPDGSCILGTHYEENLLRWKRAGASAVYYDYYMGIYGGRQRLVPMADELQAMWRGFAERGIDGSGTQIECYNMWNHLLNFYSFARTGYDSSLSLSDNINALSKIFGEGGELIADIMKRSEECLDGQAPIPTCGYYLVEHLDMDKVFADFELALSLTTDRRARNNIRLLRMAYRYTYLEAKSTVWDEDEDYESLQYIKDIPSELLYMTRFDSFVHNEPGYAITVPVRGEAEPYTPDIWYIFD